MKQFYIKTESLQFYNMAHQANAHRGTLTAAAVTFTVLLVVINTAGT